MKKIETYKGEDLAMALTTWGCPSTFVRKTITPSTVLYDFNLTDIRKLGKVEKVLQFLSAKLHQKAKKVNSDCADYGVELDLKDRIFCNFTALHKHLKGKLDGSFLLGLDRCNNCQTFNIEDAPHILVAGATASGKSVFLNSLITSFACYSANTKLVLIDPKQVEFAQFEKANNLYCPIITDTNQTVETLFNLCRVMDERYQKLSKLHLVNNSQGTFCKIVVIVDELADLMLTSGKNVEEPIVRLAQKGRAAGIHLVLATQRPTVNVVTGLIKANIPTRIAFAMASSRDSVVMLDHGGANELLGKGDALVKLPDRLDTIRIQAPFIGSETIAEIFKNGTGYQEPRKTRKNLFSWLKNLFVSKTLAKDKTTKIEPKESVKTDDAFSINELNLFDCVVDD